MFDKIRRRGFALDPSCKLWMPFYRYGSEQAKIWDQSGNQKHGTISGAVPYPGNPHITSLGSTYNRGDFTATNAFFWSSLDLSPYAGTDLGSTPYYIELLDSTGKKATGYIGAVGAGETLGSESLSDWVNYAGSPYDTFTSSGINITSAINSSGAAEYVTNISVPTFPVSALYKRVATLTLNSGQKPICYFGDLSTYSPQLDAGVNTVYRNFLASEGNTTLVVNNTAISNWSCIFTLKQITDPPSTAVHIVSSLNGTTRDWASIESGFDPNNIASWTINSVVPKPCVGWYFDGVNDRVVHSSMNLGKLHTLHYWIKRIGDASGMVHAGAVDYNGLRISDTTVGYSSGAGTAVAETHNGAPSTAIKTLISVIRILDKVTFYQNGIQIGVEQTMGGQPDDLILTDIGRYSDATSYFNGVVYEATIFNDNKGFIGVRNFFEMTRQIQGI